MNAIHNAERRNRVQLHCYDSSWVLTRSIDKPSNDRRMASEIATACL